MSETCTSCHAPIIWARSGTSGKPMPLDAEPGYSGNLRLTDGAFTVLSGAALADAQVCAEKLWLSHFVTCPAALKHRRRR